MDHYGECLEKTDRQQKDGYYRIGIDHEISDGDKDNNGRWYRY